MQRPTTTRAILLLLNVITFGSLLSYFAYDATLKYREGQRNTAKFLRSCISTPVPGRE